MDGPAGSDRHRSRRAAMGAALRHLPRPRLRGAADRPHRRAAGHGLRGEWRIRHRQHRVRSQLHLPATAARRTGLHELVPRPRLPGRGAAEHQRRRRRLPARRRHDPRRNRFPQCERQPRRTRPALRARSGDPASDRPELLPPGHRARRARPDTGSGAHRIPAGRFRRGEPRHPPRPVPRCDHRERRGCGGARSQLVLRWLQRGHRLPGGRLRTPIARARIQPDRRRPLRTAARGGGVKCCTLELRR